MVTLVAIVLLLGFVALFLFALHRERSLALLVSDLRISEQTFRRMVEQSLDAIIMVDAKSNVTYWNPAATQMFGYAPAEIIGRSVHEVLAAERHRERAVAGFNRFQATGEGEFLGKTYEVAALRKDGTEFPIELSLSPMLSGNVRNAIGIARDITERKVAQRELLKLARTDALTELPNRTTFVERLDLAFAACRRGAVPFALLFLDLDLFKEVNDTLGHHVGDTLLKQVAERLVHRMRKTDVVARFGGDEFAILQPDAVEISETASLATQLRAALTQPYDIEGNQLRITASVGIAFYTPDVSDAASVLEQADRALYLAKQEGKNRFRFYSSELDRLAHEGLSLSEELKAAIANDELELQYQPQVDVATGVIVGVEALVRWNHPTRGELKADQFIPAAERSGVIVPLGEWVLNSACRQYRRWRDEGVAPPTVAVNLSGAQMKLRSDFSASVAAALRKWGLAPGDLEFEVSEAVLAASSGWHPDPLRQLRDLGVGLTIDDFGSDYTSIGRVKAYGVKRFKIAPQFVNTMASDPTNAAVVRTMISLANQLGIELIAKNIETEAQEHFLLSIAESPEAQGYYYSQPLTSGAMTALLRSHSPDAGETRIVLSAPATLSAT